MSAGSMTYIPSSRSRWTLRCTAAWFHIAVFMAGAMITGAVVAATVIDKRSEHAPFARRWQQAVGGLSQGDVGYVDAITAVKGVDPRADAIEFEKVTGGKTQRSLRQYQIDLAVEPRVT